MGRVGGPESVLDLSPRHFIAFIEAVARKAPHHAQQLDEIYAASTPPRPQSAAEKRYERRMEIERVRALFGG